MDRQPLARECSRPNLLAASSLHCWFGMQPLGFHLVAVAIRRLYEGEPLALSLSDIATRADVPLSLCASAVAALVHEGVLKWDHERNVVLRADDAQPVVTRRTA
jgi:hypothetical protein